MVLLLVVLTPLAESFDHWDKNPGSSNDTEIHLTAWFAGVGIVLALAEQLRWAPTFAILNSRCFVVTLPWSPFSAAVSDQIKPTESPPLISLRI
jgi:hypothetical protein